MELDFTTPHKVSVSMKKMVQEIIDDCIVDNVATSPASNYLYKVNTQCKALEQHKRERFHNIVAKLLYLSKHGRPDIQCVS